MKKMSIAIAVIVVGILIYLWYKQQQAAVTTPVVVNQPFTAIPGLQKINGSQAVNDPLYPGFPVSVKPISGLL